MRKPNDSEFQRTSLNLRLYHLRDILKTRLHVCPMLKQKARECSGPYGLSPEATFAVTNTGVALHLSRGWYIATPLSTYSICKFQAKSKGRHCRGGLIVGISVFLTVISPCISILVCHASQNAISCTTFETPVTIL